MGTQHHIRAFIAVDISPQARAALEAIVEGLTRGGASGVRWVRPEGVHLTLKFLGDIDPALVDTVLGSIERAVQGTGPITLALSGVGAFPNINNPRVVWGGLKGDLETLKELQARIDETLHSDPGLPRETRPFTPHLTLGRLRQEAPTEVRRRVADAIRQAAIEGEVEWRVEEVALIRSTLTPSGAVYEVLGTRGCSGE